MKAKLIVQTASGEDVEADFNIETEEQSVTIELTPTEVKIRTNDEPKITTQEGS